MNNDSIDNKAIWKSYLPMPNHWFFSELTYEGQGTATFENPNGKIKGKVKVSCNELGDIKAEMVCEQLITNAELDGDNFFRILKFLYRNKGKGNRVAIGIGTESPNNCLELNVQSDEGVFTATENLFWTTKDFNDHIEFWISHGDYRAKTRRKTKYWVVPLINFVSSFHQLNHPLPTQHPLRLYKTPTVPNSLDDKERQIALMAAHRRYLLIAFEFGNKFGYIEPLPDYREREQNLKSGKEKQSITALMVGEIIDGMENKWFPHNYTNLISLASGSEVYAPWVEYRDRNGGLISRKHLSAVKESYEKGYAVIDETIHHGLGELVSVASKSKHFDEDYFQVLVGHLIEVNSHGRHVENHMTILGRSFEMLSEKLGVGRQDLKSYLPKTYNQDVNTILSKARKQVTYLLKRAKKEGLIDASAALQRIESKISNANNMDGDFGMKVMDVLSRYKMPDLVIMEKSYSQRTQSKGKSWIQTLSQLRNAPLHEGFFHIQDGTFDFYEILRIENHLHDALIRIVLKILEYQGKYQPRVIEYLVDEKTVDWVNEMITAKELGYKD